MRWRRTERFSPWLPEFEAEFGKVRGSVETMNSMSVQPYEALFELTWHELGTNVSSPPYGEYFHGIVGWKWDGGTHTAPEATGPQIRMSLVRAELCSGGTDCYGHRFETDRYIDRLTVWFRVNRNTQYQQGIVEHNVSFSSGQKAVTNWYPASELNFDEGDPIPGFEGATHVGWQGGSTDASRVKICTTSNPC